MEGGGCLDPPSLDLTHSKKYHRNYVQYCMLLKIFKTKKINPFSQNWQQEKRSEYMIYTVLTKVALRFPQLRARDLIRAQASGDRGFCRLASSA